ncbi:MAG: chalcone isomerase family protein [Gammaproteobacteria bacterium]|nr:chalcone isomerase family protein [Gammaproteobacteria bacterium]
MRTLARQFIMLLTLGIAANLPAAELAGVTLPDRIQAGEAQLVLNGIGLRKKAFFKVYVAGLYLPARAASETDILNRDSPRVLTMHFVRDVGRDKLVEAYREGFSANNPPERLAQLQGDIDRFLGLVTDVREGDRITFRYEPGKGSAIEVAGVHRTQIPGRDFADAYLLVFIGPKPPTEDLKSGLLGH